MVSVAKSGNGAKGVRHALIEMSTSMGWNSVTMMKMPQLLLGTGRNLGREGGQGGVLCRLVGLGNPWRASCNTTIVVRLAATGALVTWCARGRVWRERG